ncbi:pirin family protein [Fusibacter sp. JL216-2]|uniref:pirin family protein n=1 Tax=Fusibacter sp. JL216-2 TaxID=3071453 RepID=UPI003D345D45
MSVILSKKALGFHWETQDPFLFCAHHLDKYPKGTDQLGPAMPLSRRNLGQDFDLSNDWKMYHGRTVPGFPEHPHRGFETVTVVLEGFVDHFDSKGASGRYGQGDVQWMTAGEGMQHAEMFPLVHSDKENPLHLFQIWLNLPKKDKFVKPHYKMLWSEEVPIIHLKNDMILNDETAKEESNISVTLIAGQFMSVESAKPAPDSYASNPESELSIMLVKIDEGAKFTLPKASDHVKRAIYHYKGQGIKINKEILEKEYQAYVKPEALSIESQGKEAEILILQAVPINEPVAQYGPFVMNTMDEIRTAYDDYQKTRFGGWPWDRSDPVNPKDKGRFAKYEDGRVVYPVSEDRKD